MATRATLLPTYRAHQRAGNGARSDRVRQGTRGRRIMACTTSIGPAHQHGDAAAVAHVNRLPVLLPAGRCFRKPRPRSGAATKSRIYADATVSANDCFRARVTLFDRITRPEQIIAALPRAMNTLTDPAASRAG